MWKFTHDKPKRGVNETPVPLLESGLVDLDALEMYMHPNPDAVPLYATPGWKYHHKYHTSDEWRQMDRAPQERDQRYIDFVGMSYNQLHLRVGSEFIFHLYHERVVPLLPPETIDMGLRDFRRIDKLAATCLALTLTKANTSNYSRMASTSVSQLESYNTLPLVEQIDFFEAARSDATRGIGEMEIIPKRLATSALRRLSMHLPSDNYLAAIASTRLAEDPVYYPVRPPAHETLRLIACKMVSDEFGENDEGSLVPDEDYEEALAA